MPSVADNLMNQTLHSLLESSDHPLESPFIHSIELNRTWTLREFKDLVQEIKNQLNQNQVPQKESIGLMLTGSLNFMLASMAVMTSARVAVPIHSDFKSEEARLILEHSETKWILTDQVEKVKTLFNLQSSTSFHLQQDGRGQQLWLIPFQETRRVLSAVDEHPKSSDPAVILYTSGTTSAPKGVVLTHQNLLHNAAFIQRHYQIQSNEISLNVLPFFHIHAFMCSLILPLYCGSQVVIPEKVELLKIWDWLQQYKINWFTTVPAIVSFLLKGIGPEPRRLTHLRFIRVGSAPLSVEQFEQFESRFQVPILPGFGMTEGSCVIAGNPPPPGRRKAGSSGLPIGDFKIQITDAEEKTVPPGVVGEIRIQGLCVFPEYFKNPQANLGSLRDQWFYTGDLGYLDSDGYLFVTGRKSEVINVGGEKVIPNEVEGCIRKMTSVADVAVVGLPHSTMGESVTAFVQLIPETELTEREVIDFCLQHLATFKAPKKVKFVSAFKRTVSGKIQKQFLKEGSGKS